MVTCLVESLRRRRALAVIRAILLVISTAAMLMSLIITLRHATSNASESQLAVPIMYASFCHGLRAKSMAGVTANAVILIPVAAFTIMTFVAPLDFVDRYVLYRRYRGIQHHKWETRTHLSKAKENRQTSPSGDMFTANHDLCRFTGEAHRCCACVKRDMVGKTIAC